MIKVQWVPNSQLYNDNMNEGLAKPLFTPVVTIALLAVVVEKLRKIIGQAHGGAMLGGDDAYKACLAIEGQAHRLLEQLEAQKKEGV